MLKLWRCSLIGYMYFQSKRVQNFLQDLMSILWEDQFPELQWNLKETRDVVEISTKEKKEEDHYTVKPIANGKKMTE